MAGMELLAAATLAAAFTAPVPSQDDMRDLLRHYPQAALRNGWSAAILLEAIVDPEGRILVCSPVAMFGEPELAKQICAIFKGIKIDPATIDGKPSYGMIKTAVRFTIPPRRFSDLKHPADVKLDVNKLPDGEHSLTVKVNVLVGEDGKVEGCKGQDHPPESYLQVACRQVSVLGFPALNDLNHHTVRYVRDVIVEFQVDEAIDPPAPTGAH
jgi:hypothetical protein